MSYDAEHHLTTAEQCPERFKLRKEDLIAFQCLRLEGHPGPHVADANRKRAEWWTPDCTRSET